MSTTADLNTTTEPSTTTDLNTTTQPSTTRHADPDALIEIWARNLWDEKFFLVPSVCVLCVWVLVFYIIACEMKERDKVIEQLTRQLSQQNDALNAVSNANHILTNQIEELTKEGRRDSATRAVSAFAPGGD